MRYFSSVVPTTNIFHVSGLSDFPGEICNRVTCLFGYGNSPQLSEFYEHIWQLIYEGVIDDSYLTESERDSCRKLRVFLQFLETGTEPSPLFVMFNINTGESLAFTILTDET